MRPVRPSPLRYSTSPIVPLLPQFNRMPPKRRPRAPPPSRIPPPSAPAPALNQPSTLAKEHHITASTESSIRAAFDLFATTTTAPEPTLPTPSLRRALTALSAPARSRSDLQDLISAADPLSTGTISYENFVAVAALQLSTVSDHDAAAADDDDDDNNGRPTGAGRQIRKGKREVDEAFGLFLGGDGGEEEEVITLATLRRVARELKEEVGEGVLRDMIMEANGGAGVGRGVRKGEFEGVMRRAGVFR